MCPDKPTLRRTLVRFDRLPLWDRAVESYFSDARGKEGNLNLLNHPQELRPRSFNVCRSQRCTTKCLS